MALEYGMIEPFVDHQVRENVISYGLSSYGYDIRVSDEFKIFTNVHTALVDPKNFDPKSFVDYKGEVCVIPPNSFALSNTVENFRIPRNTYAVCIGKSTYARCGIIINVTGFDAEWEGQRDARDLQYDTTPLPYLRQRRDRPGALFRERRGLRRFLQGQVGEVPGASAHYTSEVGGG